MNEERLGGTDSMALSELYAEVMRLRGAVSELESTGQLFNSPSISAPVASSNDQGSARVVGSTV
jgi:hypothetical protein